MKGEARIKVRGATSSCAMKVVLVINSFLVFYCDIKLFCFAVAI